MSHTNNKLNRFSIRKYSVGVASVIIGAYFLAQQQAVSADQVAASTTSDTPTELVTEATPVVTKITVLFQKNLKRLPQEKGTLLCLPREMDPLHEGMTTLHNGKMLNKMLW